MHETHSHRQVSSVNYLELEQTAVITYTVNDISYIQGVYPEQK